MSLRSQRLYICDATYLRTPIHILRNNLTLIFYHMCRSTSDKRRIDNKDNFQQFVYIKNWKHLAYGRSVIHWHGYNKQTLLS